MCFNKPSLLPDPVVLIPHLDPATSFPAEQHKSHPNPPSQSSHSCPSILVKKKNPQSCLYHCLACKPSHRQPLCFSMPPKALDNLAPAALSKQIKVDWQNLTAEG